MNRLKGAGWRLVCGGYAAFLLVVSVLPSVPVHTLSHFDKLMHLVLYLLFAWLLMHADKIPRGPLVWCLATGYGLGLELVQGWLPWRTGEVADGVVNAIGAACGVWGWCLLHRVRMMGIRTS